MTGDATEDGHGSWVPERIDDTMLTMQLAVGQFTSFSTEATREIRLNLYSLQPYETSGVTYNGSRLQL